MTTVDYQVGASGNDSHQQSIPNDSGRNVTGTGVCSLTDTKLQVGSHSGGNEWSGAVRFTGVAVPQGATITSATFSMRGDADYNAAPNVVKLYVSAQAADDAPALSSSSADLNASARPRTTATAIKDVTAVLGGTWYDWDVTAIVQEIVNRAGWVSGNAQVWLIDTHEDTTVNEWQDFIAYDGTPASAPKISITYSSGGGLVGRLTLMGVG